MPEKSQNQKNIDSLNERMKSVNAISPTMCTAKWLQSTVYLMNGFTHSCHHPTAHKIPLEELKKDPGSLHNTEFKMLQRQLMLDGKRPSECQYCWNIEDLSKTHISDRVYKSTDLEWSVPFIDKVIQAGATKIDPTYLEVAFENTCNFKCAYCTPDISSKWMEEIKTHGPYPTSWGTGNLDWLKQNGKMPAERGEDNPYVNAFWDWWPKLYPQLKTFRITGGEPLLSKSTWRVLEEIKQNPNPELNLAINTNMDVPAQLIERLIALYNDIAPRIRSFELYTSAEAHGRQAEYIRYGMNYDRYMGNVKRFLSSTGDQSRINFMVTFNALSLTTFSKFLDDVWHLRMSFNQFDSMNRIPMMISYLRWPPFLSMQILPIEFRKKYALEIKEFVLARTRQADPKKTGRFYLEEVDQVERLCEFMLQSPGELDRDIKDFALFIAEYDKRRVVNFNETFPELKEFFENAKTAK